MTDYNNLIERLHAYFMGTGILVGSEAAAAIRKLVEERDRYKANQQQWVAAFQEARERAEKAEADLAAARAALRDAYGSIAAPHMWDQGFKEHAAAIAASMAEGGE